MNSRVRMEAPWMQSIEAEEAAAGERRVVEVELLCGRVLSVEVNCNSRESGGAATITAGAVLAALQDQYGITPGLTTLLLNQQELHPHTNMPVGSRARLRYNLAGGGGICNIETVTAIPDALNVRILCYKCGVKDFPTINDDWCTETCCCIFYKCGLKDCKDQQCCCVLVNQGGVSTEKALPQALQCRILLWKCGIDNFPNVMKDDWCTNTCCCLHSECGLKEWQKNQLLCVKCTVVGEAANAL